MQKCIDSCGGTEDDVLEFQCGPSGIICNCVLSDSGANTLMILLWTCLALTALCTLLGGIKKWQQRREAAAAEERQRLVNKQRPRTKV